MILCIVTIFFLPVGTLTTVLTTLPVIGKVPLVGLILMVIGIGWALININSLPMVVDMTDSSRIGTYTGLYYMFSTLSAIAGPIMYGLIIQLSSGQYNLLMIVSPISLILAAILTFGVKRGEAQLS
jgi:maltose/moltooligosaccharide transporter